jgi:hypothetical protein
VSPRVTWLAPLLLVAAVGSLSADALASGGWETIRQEDGIVVARKEVAGSPFVAFRGEGDVQAPLLRVGSVLVDVPRDHEWIDGIVEARVLRRVSETEYVLYSHLGTPPTMSDRDFVTDVTIAVDPAARTLVVRMRSVEDPAAPATGYVRGDIEESAFVLTQSPDGATTHVVAEIHCDPKGSVAAWMVNLFQKGWGYNTISHLRTQLRKPDIAIHPALQKLLGDRGFPSVSSG